MTLSDLTMGGVASIAGLSLSDCVGEFESLITSFFGDTLTKWAKDCTEDTAYNWYLFVKYTLS